MKRAAIVSPLRTPVGAFGGALRPVPVEELGATVARAIVQRTGLDPARIDDVVFAQSYSNGETPCTGRWVALQAGFPIDVPGIGSAIDSDEVRGRAFRSRSRACSSIAAAAVACRPLPPPR